MSSGVMKRILGMLDGFNMIYSFKHGPKNWSYQATGSPVGYALTGERNS
jgi:hypothetical protein